MSSIKSLSLQSLLAASRAGKSNPIAPKVLTVGEAKEALKSAVHRTDALIASTDAIISATPTAANLPAAAPQKVEENFDDSNLKLSRLVDDEFPFDESQLNAVYGLIAQKYGCLIGAAGTGKTTVTKKFVDLLRAGLGEVDLSQYWSRGTQADDDDYEIPERMVPNIVMCSFTGRATQQTKANFPRDWHGNIMTIHRLLGFYPEFYMDLDPETGNMVNKRRFVPAYDETNKVPWKIIIIDEAGMLGLDLWHQLFAACEDDVRIYMIGDINQLPPTHGKSILGFAMASWPVFELTHVHRQKGSNNSIVDNAHRILKGIRPVSDCPFEITTRNQKSLIEGLNFLVKDKDWRFVIIDVDDDHYKASARIRQVAQLLQGKIYEPNRDVIITPVNGFEQTTPGSSLGQAPLNRELVVKLNSDSPRYIIDAGRERHNLAVGDKVMATVNDYEAGITNGMTGLIKSITPNGAYMGDTNRFGLVSEVNAYMEGLHEDLDDSGADFNLEEMASDASAGMEEFKQKQKEGAGPASHIITVTFGHGEHAFDIDFDSKSKAASLMLAYAATCHKMQGGEAPLVMGIVHQANKRPLNREWYYTMVTRASGRCIVFTTRQGTGFALGKQSIKGTTLKQKIEAFNKLTEVGMLGPTVRVKLPKACSLKDLPPKPAPRMGVTSPDPVPVPAPKADEEVKLTLPVTKPAPAPEPEPVKPVTQPKPAMSLAALLARSNAK